MLYICGICKPPQRSATLDRALVAGAAKRFSNPLPGSLESACLSRLGLESGARTFEVV
jgi:hypothetical protein